MKRFVDLNNKKLDEKEELESTIMTDGENKTLLNTGYKHDSSTPGDTIETTDLKPKLGDQIGNSFSFQN